MLVKSHYHSFSEQLMYEWTLEEPHPYNRARMQYFAFWQSVKNLDMRELNFDDLIRLQKIEDLHKQQLKRPRRRK